MNTEKNKDSALPEGWIICASKSTPGRKYYFNRKTGSSSWTKPQPQNVPQNLESKNQKRMKGKGKEKAQAERIKPMVAPKKNLKRKSEGDSVNFSSTPIKIQNEESPSKKLKKPSLSPIKNINRSLPDSPLKRTDKSSITSSPLKRTNVSTSSNTSLTKASTSSSFNSKTSSLINTAINKKSKKRRQKPVKKNIANERLSRLQAELSAEISEAERTQSPNTSQESGKDKSPNINVSDLHSVPHPSQFFAANKIICSMKAQLPEKYIENVKQKDMFADIEQGICNQTTEYPYMKHPSTPPQFSQASKLLSALKSKLSDESLVSHKKEPTIGKSANDRLNKLRTRLSNEAMEEQSVGNSSQCNEAMEVDVKEIQTKENVPVLNNVKDTISKENVVLVVDTNIFIHELHLIKNVMNSHIKGYSEPPTLLVPWRVVNELDNLKDSNNGKGAICKRARPAMDYLYKSLPESDRIKVQPLRDANSHIYPCESPDDEILNCCLQQAERGKSVILLSNDKNLCTKAHANGVPRRSLSEFTLSSPPAVTPRVPPQLLTRLQTRIYALLSNILENEMRAKYNELWLHVVAAVPPWSLADVLKCLLKHWIAVFKDVFPRIEHLLTELKQSLVAIEKNAPNNVTQPQLTNFKELCLEVAKRCQIIPEYMELAKTTVAKLQKDDDDDDDEGNDDSNDDGVVIEAFEGVWTVYSSYCAKLASSLGISHSIEDKMPGNDSAEGLTSKLDQFGNQMTSLTEAIHGVLVENQPQSVQDESVSRLERSFKANLSALGINDAPINNNNLKLFCTKCRSMLQEALSKFSQLIELLQICKNNLNN